MKVPTYSKYGLKKFDVEQSDDRDRQVTQLLTHTLPLIAGGVLGILVFFIYYFKSGQTTVFQAFYQVFLFGTIGIICVGIPMAFFVLAERAYFYFKSKNNTKYQTIQQYKDDRDGYDFWKIRMDEGFWRTLDGLSVEKEVINLYMHMGYELKTEFETANGEHDHVLEKDGKLIYIDIKTDKMIESLEYVDGLLSNKTKAGADKLILYSKFGFSKEIDEYLKNHEIEKLSPDDVVRAVKDVTSGK